MHLYKFNQRNFANDLYISIIVSHMEFRIHPNSAFRPVRNQFIENQNIKSEQSEESAFDGSSSAFKLMTFQELQSNFLDSQVEAEYPKVSSVIVKKETSPQKVEYVFTQAQNLNERQRKPRKFPYNDTKNIPKNFGKAIIAFVQKNPQIIQACFKDREIDYQHFLLEIKKRKRQLHSIKQLRSLWLDSEFQFAQSFRKMSLYFMKRSSMKYIFNSRVVDFGGHLKYRKRIISALSCPQDFYSIKHE